MTSTIEQVHLGQTELTLAQIEALPIGAEVNSVNNLNGSRFVKCEDGWRYRDHDGELRTTGTPYGDVEFVNHWYVVVLPEPEPAVVESVTIPWQAVTAGLYLQPEMAVGDKLYVLSVTGTTARVVLMDSGGVSCAEEFDLSSWTNYRVIPHDETLINGLAELVNPPVDRHAVDQAAITARQEVEATWATRMERLNRRIHEWAERETLDGDFDDLMGEFEDIGLTRREQDYNVDINVNGTVTISVRASNRDQAEDLGRDFARRLDGSYGSVTDDNSIYINNTSVGDVEEAD